MQQFLRELRNLLCGNTGFVVHAVTTAAVLPQRAHERELLALAEPFLWCARSRSSPRPAWRSGSRRR